MLILNKIRLLVFNSLSVKLVGQHLIQEEVPTSVTFSRNGKCSSSIYFKSLVVLDKLLQESFDAAQKQSGSEV